MFGKQWWVLARQSFQLDCMPGTIWPLLFLFLFQVLFFLLLLLLRLITLCLILIGHFRIHIGEDCVSALLFKVLNLLVTVTLTAEVY